MAEPFNFKPSGDVEADIAAVAGDERLPPQQRALVIEDMKARASGGDGIFTADPIQVRKLRAPDGSIINVRGPAGASEEEWAQAAQAASAEWSANKASTKPTQAQEPKFNPFPNRIAQLPTELLAGGIRGAGSFGASVLRGAGMLGLPFGDTAEENQERRKAMDAALTELTGIPNLDDLLGYRIAQFVPETLAMNQAVRSAAPVVGGALSKIAPNFAPKLAEAMTNFGFRAPGAAAPVGLGAKAADLATRTAGGALAGLVGASVVDPAHMGSGAFIAGALPGVLGAARGAGVAAKRLGWDTWHPGAQAANSGRALGEAVGDDLLNVINNLRNAPKEIIPGARVGGVEAAGSPELASANRTLQAVSPKHAAALQQDTWAANAAYNDAIEALSGNPGRIAVLKAERDAATDPMRETILQAAGRIDTKPVVEALQRKMESPSGGQALYESTMNHFLGRLNARIGRSKDGLIPAEELYAIRKDIGDMRMGKLSPSGATGDAVKKHSSSALRDVQEVIDDVIDAASKARINANERVGSVADGMTAQRATPTWRGYLDEYSKRMREIDSYETMADVYRRIKGVDMVHGATQAEKNIADHMLSRAKLANILKNEEADLAKKLTDTQMQTLRNVLGDMQARHASLTAGKAVGSNTAQNLHAAAEMEMDLIRQLARNGSWTARALDVARTAARGGQQGKMSDALRDPDELLRQLEAFKRSRQAAISPRSPSNWPRLAARPLPILPSRSDQ